jgi:hypothetical protein
MNQPRTMEKYDTVVAFLSGIISLAFCMSFADIRLSWDQVWESALNLLWLGIVAMFTGGMAVLGKHSVGKYLAIRKKKRRQKNKKQ